MRDGRGFLLTVWIAWAGCSSLPPEEEDSGRRESLSDEQASAIFVDKGVHYMDAGQFQIALDDLNKAVELDADNSDAHNALGVLYQRIDDVAQADRHFRKALALKPDNYGARNNYGRFLCMTGHPAEAFEQFAQVTHTKLYAQPWIPLTNAGVCARSIGRPQQAESYLRKALEADPGFPPALLEMARLSREVGQPMAGRGFLQRYLSGVGPNPESLLLGIEIEMALGNSLAAEDYLNTLRARFPHASETMRAGRVYRP